MMNGKEGGVTLLLVATHHVCSVKGYTVALAVGYKLLVRYLPICTPPELH